MQVCYTKYMIQKGSWIRIKTGSKQNKILFNEFKVFDVVERDGVKKYLIDFDDTPLLLTKDRIKLIR